MAGLTPPPRKFIKFLAPGLHEKLSIPVVFSRSLHEKNEALLKSCQGYWPIKVRKHGDGLLYFEGGGWKELVEQHGLELGEFLVLKHQGIKLLLVLLMFSDFEQCDQACVFIIDVYIIFYFIFRQCY
ncbi:hypothetical protein PRUPE_1G489700 [Prunus persica]|uniref:TF-B3 domain-containing protein n=1 Tax=Prunus persica TaxID=3760 RepID=A0A251REZ0_PRUPE|nr:hypothetical protein PRUPE_1G489700 [Prunus persica]